VLNLLGESFTDYEIMLAPRAPPLPSNAFLNLKAKVDLKPMSIFYLRECHSAPLLEELFDERIVKAADAFFSTLTSPMY
jgi:hypothetical protein